MKGRLLTLSLIAVLFFSALNVALADVECPRCHGSGRITTSQTCPTCGGTGGSKPTITLKRTLVGGSEPRWPISAGVPVVTGVFQNEESVGVYGIVTAEVRTTTATYTNFSSRTYFPPHEEVTVTIIIGDIEYEPYWSYNTYVSDVEGSSCPDCHGTGVLSLTSICPDCSGTGFVAALPGATNFLVVGGAAAAVAALAVSAVLVVKRKRVTEERLRRLAPSEFQEWVVQRLLGRASSQREFYMGIDGYTGEGYPIQVKQSDDVGRNVIDSFAASIGRSKARNGIIVAFSFGRGALEGVVRAKLNYGLEIKTVTVKELMESRSRAY